MRTTTTVLLAALVAPMALHAQDPGFTGLTSTETVVVERDRYRVQATVDVAALDARLTAAEQATLRALEAFKVVIVAADKEEADFYRAFGTEAYTKMRAAAAKVLEDGAKARTLLAEVSGVFKAAFAEPMPPQTELALLERVARATRVITLYDTLASYAASKPLRYETVAPIPFNEQRTPVAAGLTWLDLPSVMVRGSEARVASREVTEVGVAGGQPVLRDRQVSGSTRTTVSLPLPVAKLRALLVEAERELDAAQALRGRLLAARVEETARKHHGHAGGGYEMASLEYRGELEAFERDVKPIVADFAVAMAKCKALRNELVAWTDVADAFVGELNLRAAVAQAGRRFDELAVFGSNHIVCYDSFRHLERQFLLIPSINFTQSYLVNPGTVMRRAAAVGQARSGASMSTQDLLSMLRQLGGDQRREAALRNLPKVGDLTVATGVEISMYLGEYTRAEFLKAVELELDRRAAGR